MEWTRERIHRMVEQQWEYFRSGKTLPVSQRIEMLKKLRNAVEEHRTELEDGIRLAYQDFLSNPMRAER